MKFEDILNIKDINEMCNTFLEGGPKDCTWRDVADYIENKYTQDQIILINKRLWVELDRLCRLDEEKGSDSDEADNIREHCEVFYYAINDENYNRFRELNFEWAKKSDEAYGKHI
jgi:hypothetical protein